MENDPADENLFAVTTHASGPTGKLPLRADLLTNAASGFVFGWTQDAGMGWSPSDLGKDEYLILSTQGGIRAEDGSPIALGYHTGHYEVGLLAQAAAHGVDAQRLVFAPFDSRDRYLARQRLGDLMLDAVHHSAMTTACDALAAALPVLTLRGTAMASRAGESLLRAAGLPELVAADADTYVAQALQLAASPPRLAEFRRRLNARAGPLFDTAARVRELEAAFLEVWQRGARRA